MNKRIANLVLLFGSAAFAIGLFELFKLRFEAGDVYPPYSSLRSDPLGTMVLFESLAKMPGVTLVRDFSAETRLPEGKKTTYLHLAAMRDEWLWAPEELVSEIQSFVLAGGRMIIAFSPETRRPFISGRPPFAPGTTPPKNPKPGSKHPSESPLLKDRWGVEFGFKALQSGEGGAYEPAQVEKLSESPVPAHLDWHSGMIFTNVNTSWTTIYSRGTNPVVIERQFGSGSVVLMSDSFCFSNEAMVRDRHSDLLAWLIGPSKTIAFDEAHLGLIDAPGVASLLRQYRLYGVIAGILLVVALFIWKNSASFLPRLGGEAIQTEIAGKNAAAGFINLLRRNIAPQDVLRVCFDEWTKSLAKRGGYPIWRVDRAQAAYAAELARAKADQDPVRAYREIGRTLKGLQTEHQTSPSTQSYEHRSA